MIISSPSEAIFIEKTNTFFSCMQQVYKCVAPGDYFGYFDNNRFLLQNILNNEFLFIQCDF